MFHRFRIVSLTSLLALANMSLAANLNPPASVSVDGISVLPTSQVVRSTVEGVRIGRATATNGWELTASVSGGQLQHSGSSAVIPARINFTTVVGLNGASTDGISISSDGDTVTSGPYSGVNSYRARFRARLDVPALPRAGSYSGTITFIITEF